MSEQHSSTEPTREPDETTQHSSTDDRPTPLTGEHLPQLRATLADASHLLVCLDFDGTLAPIVDDPDAAAPTAANETAVASLAAAKPVTTAIVSGRGLNDVRTRVDEPRIYAGNHGLELAWDGALAMHPAARERAARVEAVCETLETVLEPIPNARVENKRLTGTVHVRTVPAGARPVVRRLTRSVVERLGGDDLELSPGKRILEIGPDVDWGKGDAVSLISSELPAETVPIYIGDDVTDESAFRAVAPDGIGIRVGDDEPSAASYRVDSPDDVAGVLEWLGAAGVSLVTEGSATYPDQSDARHDDDQRFERGPKRWSVSMANE
ncbi:trehalose-phosphatase [Natrialba magadii ATCC 43099]|uniref:Trehalose 6-phosphate phosphatase n=1 Tax=Natrialba magadii (strain ATCC 43099 / DSM 3394 / CCM 3739 / CIP 104546 / IAM 13178 / JCM 8861 / NBRC 102185 / NCIMB 2190 / MS3) TaxID=547559 RepID=D3SR58_NATMM|nr:trehalose-phosphatase [Natrialba magadii]ADD06614.1 trehalose-phosphatase [Natrialba magadii ATCC 43099]ELY31925.1 trehalose-phosphatase [Natrialba magadii ATCC 43099]